MPPSTPFGPLAVDAELGPVPRSYWVVEGLLAAGAHPAAPGFEDELIARLEEAGVAVFVDLTDPVGTDAMLTDYSNALTTARHESFPISDMAVPSPGEMVDILDVIDEALERDDAVYVHCRAGVGRTGTVVGCWLVRHGVDPEAALEMLDRLRHQDRSTAHLSSPQTTEQVGLVEDWSPGR